MLKVTPNWPQFHLVVLLLLPVLVLLVPLLVVLLKKLRKKPRKKKRKNLMMTWVSVYSIKGKESNVLVYIHEHNQLMNNRTEIIIVASL
ncbi:Uncharacterised protein [Mycobacteroides abscessus subsp. abscessus]|nr:Uncharacterised protein [Mycobacteroides abscessus subsp. abscessus]